MSESQPPVRIVIASYLEPHHVDRIRAVNPRLEVVYEPHLLPRPRYAADHVGQRLERPEEDERRWVSLLAEAEVLFDFDRTHLEDLPERAPSLSWIQATSAGIGQLVARHRYVERMPETVFTTASGVHAIPLAEYTLMSILMFRRQVPEMLADQRDRRWQRFASTDLTGRSLAVVGTGSIGQAVARLASALGMRTIGVKRTVAGVEPASLHLEALYKSDELHAALRDAEHLVLSAPHTPETEGLIGAAELALLRSRSDCGQRGTRRAHRRIRFDRRPRVGARRRSGARCVPGGAAIPRLPVLDDAERARLLALGGNERPREREDHGHLLRKPSPVPCGRATTQRAG